MYFDLIDIEACRADGGTFVSAAGLELAVFVLEDRARVVVTDNACPHANGNLAGGEVADSVVTCPWHQWEFDLTTGVCTHSERARVRVYPSKVEGGRVLVDFGDRVDPP